MWKCNPVLVFSMAVTIKQYKISRDVQRMSRNQTQRSWVLMTTLISARVPPVGDISVRVLLVRLAPDDDDLLRDNVRGGVAPSERQAWSRRHEVGDCASPHERTRSGPLVPKL